MSTFHQFLHARNIPRIYFTGYDALLANTRILLRSDKFKKCNLYTIFSLKKKDLDLFLVQILGTMYFTCLSNFSCNLSQIDLCETVRLKTKFDSVVSLRIYRKESNWYLLVPNFGRLRFLILCQNLKILRGVRGLHEQRVVI